MERKDGKAWFDVGELKQLLWLALPLLAANWAQVGMGVVDTIVAGRAGTVDMAGAALGCSLTLPVLFSGSGLLSIIGPMISRLRGEGREGRIGTLLRSGVYCSLLLSVVILLILGIGRYLFPLLTEDEEMRRIASDYVYAVMWGTPAFMAYCVFKSLFEGFEWAKVVMIVGLGGLLCNIPANFAFVFGWWGLPAMGGVGCGAATALIYWIQLVLMVILLYSSDRLRPHCKRMLALKSPSRILMGHIFKLGYPLGVSVFCEVSFFTATSMVLACFGPVVVGAQQISLNVSGVVFSLPLSLGIAVSIRMAWHAGRHNSAGIDALTRTGLCTTILLSLIMMVLIVAFRYQVIDCYTEDGSLITIAQGLLVLCAVYQCPDSIQSFMGGVLRGLHDTEMISRITIFTYWCVGFPLCWVLVRTDWLAQGLGASGAWLSFIVALVLTAILFSLRYVKTRRNLFNQWFSEKKNSVSHEFAKPSPNHDNKEN